jgi:hypothetical protein
MAATLAAILQTLQDANLAAVKSRNSKSMAL